MYKDIPVPRYGKVRKTILREEKSVGAPPPPKQIDNSEPETPAVNQSVDRCII